MSVERWLVVVNRRAGPAVSKLLWRHATLDCAGRKKQDWCDSADRSVTDHVNGVGTVGATWALAPGTLKPRGQQYLFTHAITCQVYQLVASQTSIYIHFCISRLHESSPIKHPQCTKTLRGRGFAPNPTVELLALPRPSS